MYDIRQYNRRSEEQKSRRARERATAGQQDSRTDGRTERRTDSERDRRTDGRKPGAQEKKNRRTRAAPRRSAAQRTTKRRQHPGRKEEQKTRQRPQPHKTRQLYITVFLHGHVPTVQNTLTIDSSDTKTDSPGPISDSPRSETKKQRVVKCPCFFYIRACACDYYILCDFLSVDCRKAQ